jgi:Las1-like
MDICKSIGVPPWIVQLRHDGSHGDMQDSHVVRDALIFAIQWLKVSQIMSKNKRTAPSWVLIFSQSINQWNYRVID